MRLNRGFFAKETSRMLCFVKKALFSLSDIQKCLAFSERAGPRILWLES